MPVVPGPSDAVQGRTPTAQPPTQQQGVQEALYLVDMALCSTTTAPVHGGGGHLVGVASSLQGPSPGPVLSCRGTHRGLSTAGRLSTTRWLLQACLTTALA